MDRGILMFGNDCDLLGLRAKVLSREGWSVTTLCKPGRTISVSSESDFVLGIMCHTLAPSQRDQAIKYTRGLCPRAKIIVLTSVVHATGNIPPGVTVVTGFEPGRLVVTCDRLIKAAWSEPEHISS